LRNLQCPGHKKKKGDAFYTDSHGNGLQDRKLVHEMLAGGVGDYTGHKEAGLRAVLDMWMLASAHDLGKKTTKTVNVQVHLCCKATMLTFQNFFRGRTRVS
jgi:hypothetical protein